MRHNRIFRRSLAVLMSLALCAGMVLPALAITVEAKKVCGFEYEHTHTEECYAGSTETEEKPVLVCGKTTETIESGHVHTDECYVTLTEPKCGHTTEGSGHTDECYDTYEILTCTTPEHTHSDLCQRTCTTPEHTHSDECQRTCDLNEHTHGGACFDEDGNLVCDEEEHTHTNECERTCSMEEHTHSDDCQRSCDLEAHTHNEDCGHEPVKKLICTDPAHSLPDEENKHTEDCYRELVCKQEETEEHFHEHTGACYEIQTVLKPTCGLEEHQHTADCYTKDALVDGKEVQKTLEEALKEAIKNAGDAAAGSEGKKVTLILNGQVLEYSRQENNEKSDNMWKETAIVLSKGQTLNIEDAIGGGGLRGDGGENGNIRLIYVSNGTVNLTGGTLSGGSSNKGGAVYVEGKDGTFNMSGGTITGNKTNTTDYNNADEPVGQGGGVFVGQNGTFNMSGGTISDNTAGEGGGVFVDYSQVNGKGPYYAGEFNMTGGTIDHNTATLGEGGGVYIKGTGTITSGAITNNVTNTYKDLGGGGIYIESDGTLTLKNAIIIGNTANGMGGGIASCVHGKTYVYALDGAVITGNNALGEGHSAGHLVKDKDGNWKYNGSFVDGYSYWATAEEVFKDINLTEAAQDIFAAGDSFEASFRTPGTAANGQGTAGIVVSNNLPNGAGAANWSGYTFSYVTDGDGKAIKDDNGNYIFELTEVSEDNNGVVYGNRLVFLTSDPSEKSVQEAIKAMQNGVLISGNLSANSHGGGIANNGVLTIGEGPMNGTDSYRPDADLTKNLDSDDENVSIADKTFEFSLTDEAGALVGTVTNDKDGKATFNFPPEYFDNVRFPDGVDEVALEFFVTEINDGQENVTYDGTVYKVVITVTRTTEEVKLGHKTVTLETISIGEPQILVMVVDENDNPVLDADGNETYAPAPNGIVFNNTYTTPPPSPTDPGGNETPEPSDDPDPTPTPSQTPTPTPTPETPAPEPEPEPLPDPEVPLNPAPEEPVEEIPEPEVPLAPAPEEPLEEIPEPDVPLANVEIPDEEVPLAEVPKTGDISLLWYVAAAMSACGLAVLGLRKKTRS